MRTTLEPALVGHLLAELDHAAATSAIVGPPAGRQPNHVVYGGAHRFRADTAPKLGALARAALAPYGPADLARILELPPELADDVHARTVAKLAADPVEDFRIDFEDGFGPRSDAEEDQAALAGAEAVTRGARDGTLPPRLGIRIKPLTPTWSRRALRTLDLFLSAVPDLPAPFVVTLPKIERPQQVTALTFALDRLDPVGRIGVELMIETPAAVLDRDGRNPIPAFVRAGRGRVVALHLGAYDYTAALGIAADDQRLDHPACEHARREMAVAAAQLGLFVSDGATTLLPLGDALEAGWRAHARNVRHALATGFPQGWDLHPAQIPARVATTIAHHRQRLAPTADRLRRFLAEAAAPIHTGGVFDDAATGQGLLNALLQAVGSGAASEAEIAGLTGLTVADLAGRSFADLVGQRSTNR